MSASMLHGILGGKQKPQGKHKVLVVGKKVASAMKEVHDNVPKNVVKTGKTGASKEKMLRAIAFSKAQK